MPDCCAPAFGFLRGATFMWRMLSILLISGALVSCFGGGGESPTPTATSVVSGTVQAPNAQIAFAPSPGFFERVANLLNSSAYASIPGLSPVADGTQVQLARFNGAGTGFSVLATTMTAGGNYTFDLNSLNLPLSNDLIVRVANGSVQMRGFVTGSHVDLDPISETS